MFLLPLLLPVVGTAVVLVVVLVEAVQDAVEEGLRVERFLSAVFVLRLHEVLQLRLHAQVAELRLLYYLDLFPRDHEGLQQVFVQGNVFQVLFY